MSAGGAARGAAAEHISELGTTVGALKAALKAQYLSGLPEGLHAYLFKAPDETELDDSVTLKAPADCTLVLAYFVSGATEQNGEEVVVVRLPYENESIFNASVCTGRSYGVDVWSAWPAQGAPVEDQDLSRLPLPTYYRTSGTGKFIRPAADGTLRIRQVPREVTQVCLWARRVEGAATVDAAPPRKYYLPITSAARLTVVVRVPKCMKQPEDRVTVHPDEIGGTIHGLKAKIHSLLPFAPGDFCVEDLYFFGAGNKLLLEFDSRRDGGTEIHLVIAKTRVINPLPTDQSAAAAVQRNVAHTAVIFFIVATGFWSLWTSYENYGSTLSKTSWAAFMLLLCAYQAVTNLHQKPDTSEENPSHENVVVFIPTIAHAVFYVSVGKPLMPAIRGLDYSIWRKMPPYSEAEAALKKLVLPIANVSRFYNLDAGGKFEIEHVPADMKDVQVWARLVSGDNTTMVDTTPVIKYNIPVISTASSGGEVIGGGGIINGQMTREQLAAKIIDAVGIVPQEYKEQAEQLVLPLTRKAGSHFEPEAIADKIIDTICSSIPPLGLFRAFIPSSTRDWLVNFIRTHMAQLSDEEQESGPSSRLEEILHILSANLDLRLCLCTISKLSHGVGGFLVSTCTFSLLVATISRMLTHFNDCRNFIGQDGSEIEFAQNRVTGAHSVIPLAAPFAAVFLLAAITAQAVDLMLQKGLKSCKPEHKLPALNLVTPLLVLGVGCAVGAATEIGNPYVEMCVTASIVVAGGLLVRRALLAVQDFRNSST